jgi:hypothetical protein
MKDATGELSMTAIAVVAIAAIAMVFSQLIWPSIRDNITRSAKCSQAYQCDCNDGSKKGDLCKCKYYDEQKNGGSEIEVYCPDANQATAGPGA